MRSVAPFHLLAGLPCVAYGAAAATGRLSGESPLVGVALLAAGLALLAAAGTPAPPRRARDVVLAGAAALLVATVLAARSAAGGGLGLADGAALAAGLLLGSATPAARPDRAAAW